MKLASSVRLLTVYIRLRLVWNPVAHMAQLGSFHGRAGARRLQDGTVWGFGLKLKIYLGLKIQKYRISREPGGQTSIPRGRLLLRMWKTVSKKG
jgi:hypothetical protein